MKVTFTLHALQRLEKRKLLKEEIIEAIHYADKVIKEHEKYYFQKHLERGNIEIVCEKTERDIKVITIYWL